MTLEELRAIGDNASVQIAAGPRYLHQGHRLEPRLWEDLRQEFQHRLRLATGETHAVVSFHFEQEVMV